MKDRKKMTFDADRFREQFAMQEPRLVEAAHRLAHAVASLSPDARFAHTQPRSLIVGGFVRDVLCGGHPKDIDMEIYGVAPERLESLLQQLYPGLVNTVGRSFGILKIHLGDDVEFDVSIPRRESKSGQGHAGFLIDSDPAMTTTEAARRRDFTINAIAADPLTGEIIDPFGGIADLTDRLLRVTDPERFQDDPLRVYRAVQFAARLHLRIESHSRELMREMVARGDLDQLSRERVTEELKKLFVRSDQPSIGLEVARDIGIIERDFSELHALIGCAQEPEWHPEGDVWIHTMMVVDHAARLAHDPLRGLTRDEQLDVVFGALCHDLGKPATTNFEDGKIRSRGHEAAGEQPTRELCKRLSFSDRTVESAVVIATHHLKPWALHHDLEMGKMSETAYINNIRKLLQRIHPMRADAFLTATESDFRGRAIPGVDTAPYPAGTVMREVIAEHQLDQDPTKDLVSGKDLLALGLKPGKQLGDLIRFAEGLRDDGKITTREEALEAIKQHLAS